MDPSVDDVAPVKTEYVSLLSSSHEGADVVPFDFKTYTESPKANSVTFPELSL